MFFLGVETLCNADRLTTRIQILHTYVYKHINRKTLPDILQNDVIILLQIFT